MSSTGDMNEGEVEQKDRDNPSVSDLLTLHVMLYPLS